MENLMEKIASLFAENRGAEAERLMEQALEEAYEKQDFLSAVPILNELIGYCRETSQVERSYAYSDIVQDILQKMGLEDTTPYATTLLNIANAYRAGGRLEDSFQLYEKVAKIYRIRLQQNDMLWASFYNNISLLYQEMGKFDLAKESLLEALAIVLQNKDTVFEQAVTYTNLATTCLQLAQEDEAEKYLTGAILLFERNQIQGSHYFAALSSLGTLCYQKKEYQKAEEYFVKAMQGIEAEHGKNEFYYRMEENVQICREAAGGTRSLLSSKRGYGLELCREYYEVYCKPMLETEFPAYVDKITVGLVGEGSDCFGFDDEYSRDHDWGPSLCLWVDDVIYEEIGEALKEAYDKLPKSFKGYEYRESMQAKGRRGVQKISDFYRGLLGAANCPKDGQQWEAQYIGWENVEECRLAAAVNGQVFASGSGEFEKIREILKQGYPKRLRMLKIAEAAARFAQSGQYNYPRMLKRGDKVAAQLMVAECVKEAMKLLYYVAGEYPPHEKWLFYGLCKKQEYKEYLKVIERIAEASDSEKLSLCEELGSMLANWLYRKDYISDVSGFLQEHVSELLFKASVVELSVEELAERIAGTEFEAFDKVKNQGGRASCQDDWHTFSIMRKSQYLTWNRTMLLQYYYDFTREFAKGHNLIEEKYGRMMESTAPAEYEKLKEHFPAISEEKKQIIESIVGMQVKWMETFAAEYPKLAGNARSIHTYEDHMFHTSYETYLRGEISTYSDKMLELYGRYIVEYAKVEKNPAKDIMENSVKMYGYEGLEKAEAGL